jgi:hypothetical protein
LFALRPRSVRPSHIPSGRSRPLHAWPLSEPGHRHAETEVDGAPRDWPIAPSRAFSYPLRDQREGESSRTCSPESTPRREGAGRSEVALDPTSRVLNSGLEEGDKHLRVVSSVRSLAKRRRRDRREIHGSAPRRSRRRNPLAATCNPIFFWKDPRLGGEASRTIRNSATITKAGTTRTDECSPQDGNRDSLLALSWIRTRERCTYESGGYLLEPI